MSPSLSQIHLEDSSTPTTHRGSLNMNVQYGDGDMNHVTGDMYKAETIYIGQSPPEPSQPLLDCMKSLAFPEMDHRSYNIDTAAKGTCEWLLRHETFVRWVRDRSLLWIKGNPGSGKSTLLRHALSKLTADKFLVLSFFHGRGVELQKTRLGLFRSLLHQMLEKVPEACVDLIETFK